MPSSDRPPSAHDAAGTTPASAAALAMRRLRRRGRPTGTARCPRCRGRSRRAWAQRPREPLAVEPARHESGRRRCTSPATCARASPRPRRSRLLLAQVGADRVAAVVPDHRRRAEAERPAALLQPPADVDVVAGHAELRVEPADRLAARSLRNAMLQPGMCSATSSESSTWIGPPGALATHSATGPSPGGGMFGPPTPAWSRRHERRRPGR